jgi:hypothetical protein
MISNPFAAGAVGNPFSGERMDTCLENRLSNVSEEGKELTCYRPSVCLSVCVSVCLSVDRGACVPVPPSILPFTSPPTSVDPSECDATQPSLCAPGLCRVPAVCPCAR